MGELQPKNNQDEQMLVLDQKEAPKESSVDYTLLYHNILALQNNLVDIPQASKELSSQYVALEKDLGSSNLVPGHESDSLAALRALNDIGDVVGDSSASAILMRNWDKVGKIGLESIPGRMQYFSAVRDMITMDSLEELEGGSEYEKKLAFAKKVRKEALPYLEETIKKQETSDEIGKIFIALHEGGGEVSEELDRVLNENLSPKLVSTIMRALEERGDFKKGKKYGQQTERIFKKYDGNIKKHVKTWSENSPEKSAFEYTLKNMERLAELEVERPGAVRELEKNFGVVNLARYPKEILLRQLGQKNKDGTYGVMFYPKTDWNGALQENKWLPQLGEKLSGLEKPVMLRIFEVDSVFELAKRTARLDDKFGRENKISFGILAGHGDPSSIELGSSGKLLQKKDLVGNSAKRFGRFFKEDADIIFVSCSTGEKGGIAEDASTALELNVTGPTTLDSMKKIDVSEDKDGRVRLVAEYGYEKKPPVYKKPRVRNPEIDDFDELQKARREVEKL